MLNNKAEQLISGTIWASNNAMATYRTEEKTVHRK